MRKTIATLTMLLILGAFTACSAPLAEGTVTGKVHEPYKEWTTEEADYDTRCVPKTRTTYVNGKSQTSTYQDCQRYFDGYETVEHSSPECYRINYAAKKERDSLCVTEAEFTAIQVGDRFVRADYQDE